MPHCSEASVLPGLFNAAVYVSYCFTTRIKTIPKIKAYMDMKTFLCISLITKHNIYAYNLEQNIRLRINLNKVWMVIITIAVSAKSIENKSLGKEN